MKRLLGIALGIVYEGGFVGIPEHLLAVFGANILGKSPDCASGGAGCP